MFVHERHLTQDLAHISSRSQESGLTVNGVDHGVGGDVLHDVVVLQLPRALLLEQVELLLLQVARAHRAVRSARALHGLAHQVRDEPDDLAVAVGRLRVGEGGERGGGLEAGALGLHLGRLAALRLGELGRDDDQAQVDHEERADLELKNVDMNGLGEFSFCAQSDLAGLKSVFSFLPSLPIGSSFSINCST